MDGFCEKCGHLADVDSLCLKHWRALRDRFAMAAATGLLANRIAPESSVPGLVANFAYQVADAMLEARAKGVRA